MVDCVDQRRRLLLQTVIAGTIIAALPRPSSAVAPAVVLAVAQFALNVISLTRRSGGSIGALLQLQVEMLRAISEQLVVLQQGIATILTQLTEIQEMLGRLPGEVVDELYRRRISGLLGTYAEIMAAYQADLHQGITFAQGNAVTEIEIELLRPLREVRSVLMATPSYLNAPILAAALQCEVHAMIMAGYRSARVKPALTRYHSYFTDALATQIRPRLVELRKAREEALTKVETDTAANFPWQCVAKFQYFPPEVGINICNGQSPAAGRFEAIAGEYAHSVRSDASALGGILDDVTTLTSEGYLTTADYPLLVEKSSSSWDAPVAVQGCYGSVAGSTRPDLIAPRPDWVERMRKLPDCKASHPATLRDEYWKAESERSIASSAGVVCYSALEASCMSALGAIEKFGSEADAAL